MSTLKFSRAAAWAIAGAALLVFSTDRLLGAGVEPPNPKDLTQGTWEMNVEKTKVCPNARGVAQTPRGGGRVIRDVGWGMIVIEWIDINDNGERYGAGYPSYVYRYDGDKYPAGKYFNRPSNEGITWKLVNPHRVEFTHWSKDGKMTSDYVRTVTDDGQEMTQTTKVVGRECVDVQVFDRKPDAPVSRPTQP